MSTIIDKIKIPREHDKRVKLTEEDKSTIRLLYHFEHLPIREIARRYEKRVCRRTIQFILFPERDAKLKRIKSETKAHLKYYDREKHGKCIKDLRKRKRKIFGLKTYKHPSQFRNEKPEEKARIEKLMSG